MIKKLKTMKNKTGLLLILLILSNSSFAQQSDGLAPEATAAEVEAAADGSEVPFWDIPMLENAFIDPHGRIRHRWWR